MRVKELAAFLDAPFEGDGDRELRRVTAFEDAAPGDLSFLTRDFLRKNGAPQIAASSAASCLLVPSDFENTAHLTVVRVTNPRGAIARAIARLHPHLQPVPGVHATAIIGPGAVLAAGVHIAAFVTVGAGAHIGTGTSIGEGSVIGDQVTIGEHCILHPRVTIYPNVTLGREVVLHSGVVLGADGFGYVFTNGAWENFPQIGRVEIGDRVEIGANSCVDRAALGVTSIGEGTKLDNMVHVGHNCRIGRHVVVAAQTGFSGGVVVEDYAVIGGQVGVGDKARIESGAIIGSGAGILTSKIVRAGEPQWGTPARPLKEHLAQLAILSRLAKDRNK